MARQKVIHLNRGNGAGAPPAGVLNQGEIALNYTKNNEKIYLENSNGEMVSFPTDDQVNSKLGTKTLLPNDIVYRVITNTDFSTAEYNRNLIVEDLVSTTITITPQDNSIYKYGTLSSLTLSSIPNSSNPTFIYFTSGATATTLSYPASTPTMGYMIPASNTSYMLSILNGKLILTSVSNG